MRYLLRRILQSVLLPPALVVLFATVTCGQEYSYARYDVKDGLAGSVVYCATEDKDGFLWFGTETGVSRFDGTHFRNYTMRDGLPDNEVLKLFVDSRNRVWMMPFRNSICYYWQGKVYNQSNDSLLKCLPSDVQIIDIAEDSSGNLMIVAEWEIYFISPAYRITVFKGFNGQKVLMLKGGTRKDGRFSSIGIAEHSECYWFTFAPGTFAEEREQVRTNAPSLNTSWVSPALEIYGKADSLVFIDRVNHKNTTLSLPSNFINVTPVNDSIFVIGTTDGALLYDLKSYKLIRQVLKGKVVNHVMQDSEGSFWFMTAGTGIFRIGSFEFVNYTFKGVNDDKLAVFSIKGFDSLLYAGTEGSMVWTIDPVQQKVQKHLLNTGFYTRVSSFLQLPDKHILMGTSAGVIPFGHKIHLWKTRPDVTVKSLSYSNGKLLISTHTGIHQMAQDGGYDPIPLWTGRTTCAVLHNNTIYFGTLNGLYSMDSSHRAIYLGNLSPLFKSRITALESSADGTLWIATSGNGIVGYRNGKIIYSIKEEDGLTSDICRNLYLSGNEVWTGTDRGLNRVSLLGENKYRITTFSCTDGLLADIVNGIYVKGQQVFVATPAGITCFDADRISLHSYCKLRITGIHTPHTSIFRDTSGFVLPHADNDVRIEYVGISYRSAGDVTYRYRLKGLNDNWQTTRETFISYPSLPSGDYELQLTAVNKFGVESEMIHLPFSIEKLLWEKNWFRILALIVICGIVWFFVSLRIKRIRRQNDEKAQMNDRMVELEQMALKAQMNPHFIFNSLNSVQHYVIEKDILGANKFITEFSRLIRMTLDISSKTSISVYEEISYLTTYLELEKTKFENKFSYEIDLATDLDPSEWYIPPMILQPYVENSIRHGVRNRTDNKGYIRILISSDLIYLVFSIEDNGVGREVAASYKSQLSIEYQSKGMTLTAKRIEMLNKGQQVPVLIEVEDLYSDHVPAGTRVILKFPLVDADKND